MKKILFLVLALAWVAQADVIKFEYNVSPPDNSGKKTEEAWLRDILGKECCVFLGKYEVDDEEWEYGDFGQVTLGYTPEAESEGTSPATATVSWDLADGWSLCGIVIKGGEGYDVYVPDLESPNEGDGTVPLWVGDNGNSHISFFGCPGERVPDGGTTLALLGLAFGSLGVIRRRLNNA